MKTGLLTLTNKHRISLGNIKVCSSIKIKEYKHINQSLQFKYTMNGSLNKERDEKKWWVRTFINVEQL